MTQEELAEKSKVSRRVISELETGKRDVITSQTMIKLSKALQTGIAHLFLL